ncbi:hypothetical protein B296_00059261, partial [Ensete ventricosum]
MIKSIKEYKEEVQEPEEENTKEDPQPADCTTHALVGHTNPQAIKVEESFKQQSVTVLTNNFMNGKGEQVILCEKHRSKVMMISKQCLQKFTEISSAAAESSPLLLTRLYDLHMLILQKEPLVYIRPYCCPPRFSLLSGKAPYRSVCTGLTVDRYADWPLSGGTASRLPSIVDCGKNRSSVVNFDRGRSISAVGGRLRIYREGKTKKKERYLEPPSYSRDVAAHGSPASRRGPRRP